MADSDNLCDYGCGQEAKYYSKHGKKCCSSHFTRCPKYVEKMSDIRKGKPSPHKGKKRDFSPEARKKMGDATRGKPAWNKGLTGHLSEKTLKNMSDHHKGKEPANKGKKGLFKHTEEHKKSQRQRMLNGGSERANSFNTHKPHSEETKRKISIANTGRKHTEEFKEARRQYMLNGGALKMIKAIKKISNEEIKLRNMVKELYSECEFQYSIFRYSLDVAIPEFKIAIEYDGYYHFKNLRTKEEYEYYINRRKRIEDEGWKFYRVTMFDKFPSLEEVKENIIRLIMEINKNG